MIVLGHKCFTMGISHVCSDASLDLIRMVAYFSPLYSFLVSISMLFCVLVLVLIKVDSVIEGHFADFTV